jgi:hypothetical protein
MAKGAVLNPITIAVHDHQPRGIARLNRRLSDQFLWKIIVEVACFHVS